MSRKIIWLATGLVAALGAFAAISYLVGGQQVVEGFTHGYPPQLRVILGIAKLLGAVALLVPAFPTLKEWAYAGFTFNFDLHGRQCGFSRFGMCFCHLWPFSPRLYRVISNSGFA